MNDLSTNMMMDQVTTLAMDRIPTIPQGGAVEKIKKAAKEFEAVFASQMLKPMFEEISTDGMFGGGQAEGIYRSLMIQEIGQLIADRGGLGIADTVGTELLKIHEGKSAAQAAMAYGQTAASTSVATTKESAQ